jgi:cytochrome c oxidase assembly protein Cox11
MLGLVAYSPTLYRLFCAATGLEGTTQRVNADGAKVSAQTINVFFEANVAPGLAWRFEPAQHEVKVHLGEQKLVFFTAENLSDETLVGHATFNVTPEQSGVYFNKIQCFCFDDERLEPHQKVDMPVVFFVDPSLAQDKDIHSLTAITLTYTFFHAAKPKNPKDLSRFLANAEPDATRGQELFGERCSSCHALDANKIGPALRGVVGRRAGSVPGFAYSSALGGASLVWNAEYLDHWLADPRQFIAGARMPARVLDPSTRRDIVAYLQKESPEAAAGTLKPRTVAQGPGK